MKPLQILKQKALLITTSKPTDAATVTEGAEVIDGSAGKVFVPWTQSNAMALAHIGAPTLSAIARDYDFPGRFTPMPHQLRICNFLTLYPRGFCFADMGLGKTACGIWSADYLMQIGLIKKVLVVCPLSICEAAWGDEIFKVKPNEPYAVLHGAASKRRALAKSPARWHIINFDGIEVIKDDLVRNDYDLIIIDESTGYKNHKTSRWKALASLIKPTTYCWGFTGTPVPNFPTDAYGQAKLITPQNVRGLSFTAFKERTMKQVSQFRWLPLAQAKDEVNKILTPAIRMRKVDCLKDLPPVTFEWFYVELSKEQKHLLKKLREEETVTADGFTITAVHAASLLSKVLQISTGAVYDTEGVAVSIPMTPRIEQVKELVAQARCIQATNGAEGGKTLIFTQFRHTVEVLQTELSKLFNVAVIHGDVSPHKRAEIVSTFQNTPEIDVIIAVASTMSHGITATAANTAIWFGPVMSGEVYQQACNRMDRPGQTQNMLIAHMYSSSIEKRWYDILSNRKGDQDATLDLYNEFMNSN